MTTLALILIATQPYTIQHTGTVQVDDIIAPWTMLDIDPSLVVDNGAMQWLLAERASAVFFVPPVQLRRREQCVPELPTVVLLLAGFWLVRLWR